MSNDLTQVPEQDLRAEIARREAIKKAEREAKLRMDKQLVIDNVDLFLKMAPDHDRASCDDEGRQNAHGRCLRCALLEVKKYGYNEGLTLSLQSNWYSGAVPHTPMGLCPIPQQKCGS